MCGIAGIISTSETGTLNLKCTENAVQTLHQRGPDNQNVFYGSDFALGHARLSIIDTSESANQPFTSDNNRFTIVFNGEIYNYKELRAILETKGINFKTLSDTETLLYWLIVNGTDGIKDLNGFFAFCLHDKEKNEFILARDRFGIKPLSIYKDDNQIIFASELKAIFKYPIKKEIDFASLQAYLKFNYIPQPYSILQNVFKLKAGHYLKIEANKNISEHQYYSIPYNPKSYSDISYDNAQKELFKLLDESVERRMIADVPLGSFLSGGIDSSVIAGLASKKTDKLNTFSIGYKDEPLFDETEYAKIVAKKFNTEHTVFSLSNNDLFEQLNTVLDYTDEPFADSSGLAVNILSMNTRKHATVALSGDGADEIFSGYNKHLADYIVREKGVKNNLVKLGKPLWSLLPKSRNSKIGNLNRQLLRFSVGMSLPDGERYWNWAGFYNDKDASSFLLKPDDNYQSRKKDFLDSNFQNNDFNDSLIADMQMVLQGDMLTKVDLNSMCHSLEVRVPFLDHNIVNFAFSLPSEFKINKKIKKRLLQDTYRNFLPQELYNRKKHGFEVPLLNWFRTDLNSKIENEYLNQDFIEQQGIFNPLSIQRLIQKLKSNNPEDSTATIWALIVFQHWYKKYFTN